MCFTNRGLVEYCKKNVGNPYIYGCYGTLGNAKLLQTKHDQYPRYVTDNRVEIVKANPSKYYNKPWHDCAGLVKGYLMSKGITVVYQQRYDLSADAFYSKATRKGSISSIPEIPGLGLWKSNHFGVYIGGGRVIQAKGFDYGVVEDNLSDTKWTNWCEIPFIEYDSDAVAPAPSTPEPEPVYWIGLVITQTDDLNIRASSDPNSTIIGTLPRGTYWVFKGEPVNGMAKLANTNGWCAMRYLAKGF